MKPVTKLLFVVVGLCVAISFSPPVFANDPPDDLINSDSKSKPKAKKTVTKKPKPTQPPKKPVLKDSTKAKATGNCKKYQALTEEARATARKASKAEQDAIKAESRAKTKVNIAAGEADVWSKKINETDKKIKAAKKAGDKAGVDRLNRQKADYQARLNKAVGKKIEAGYTQRDAYWVLQRAADGRSKADKDLRAALDKEDKCRRGVNF